jgi:transposase
MLFSPLYSPDLAPTDFVFSKLKISLKGTRFEAVSSVQQFVTRELKAILEEAFSRAFDSLCEQCKRYAEAGRDYIEC